MNESTGCQGGFLRKVYALHSPNTSPKIDTILLKESGRPLSLSFEALSNIGSKNRQQREGVRLKSCCVVT